MCDRRLQEPQWCWYAKQSERCVLIPYSRDYSQKQQNKLKFINLNPVCICCCKYPLFSTQLKDGISALNKLMAFCCNIFHSIVQVLNWKAFLSSNLNLSVLQFKWFCIFARTDSYNPTSLSFIILNAFLPVFKYLSLLWKIISLLWISPIFDHYCCLFSTPVALQCNFWDEILP